MDISRYCYICKNYDSKECKEKGYVHDMQQINPECYEGTTLICNIEETIK